MKDILTTHEAADYLGLTEGYLRILRVLRKGPLYYKSGVGRVFYYLDDVQTWHDERNKLERQK